MADDLDSFFAKKKTKKKTKAEGTDDLARKLERAVRQHEQVERDREDEERKERELQEQPFAENNDSEWNEVPEPQDVNLDTLQIRELDMDEIEQYDDEIDENNQEKPKTWNVSGADEKPQTAGGVAIEADANEEQPKVDAAVKQPEAPKKYIAPGARARAVASQSVQPDFQNTEEFPSLAAAEEFDKVEQEKKKKTAQRMKAYNEQQQHKISQDRHDKELTPTTAPPPATMEKAPTVSPVHTPSPGAYVPPAFRKKLEEQQKLSTQNRFDTLKD